MATAAAHADQAAVHASGRTIYADALKTLSAHGLLKFPYLCKPHSDQPDAWLIAGSILLAKGAKDTIVFTDLHCGVSLPKHNSDDSILDLRFLTPPKSHMLNHILRKSAISADRQSHIAQNAIADDLARRHGINITSAAYFTTMARETTWQRLAARGISTLRGALWTLADPEKLRITFRIFGYTSTVQHYNLVASLWDQTRPGEPRQITLADLARTHFAALKIELLHRDLIQYTSHLAISDTATTTPVTTKATPRDVIEMMPDSLRHRGLRPAVWRTVTRCKPEAAKKILVHALNVPVIQPNPNDPNAATTFRPNNNPAAQVIHTLVSVKPETLPTSSIDILTGIAKYATAPIVQAVATEIRRRCRKGGIRRFMPELHAVLDTLRNAHVDRVILPENITWTGLKALSDEWHAWTIASRYSNTHRRWQPLLGHLAITDAAVTEILDSDALAAEGRTMHHCVGSYDRACASGHVRIFHIEVPGTPPSTLEIKFSSHKQRWEIGQHYSFCNQIPAKANVAAAAAVLRRANRAPLYDGADPPSAEITKRTGDAATATNPFARYPQRPGPFAGIYEDDDGLPF